MTTANTAIDLGGVQVEMLSDGQFWLDGGAMFGATPKTTWAPLAPPDDKNRIRLGLNCLLVRSGDLNILVEAGIGSAHAPKFNKIFRVEREQTLIDQLKARDIGLDQIHQLVLTHVHFDHSGWITHPFLGDFVPTFPNAEFFIQEKHWRQALSPHRTVAASFIHERLSPWIDHSNIRLLPGPQKIGDFMEVIDSEGHTEGHQSILIHGENHSLCFTGDLIPTKSHLPRNHIMAYDRFPELTYKNKHHLLQRAHQENWVLALPHEPDLEFGQVGTADGEYQWKLFTNS